MLKLISSFDSVESVDVEAFADLIVLIWNGTKRPYIGSKTVHLGLMISIVVTPLVVRSDILSNEVYCVLSESSSLFLDEVEEEVDLR